MAVALLAVPISLLAAVPAVAYVGATGTVKAAVLTRAEVRAVLDGRDIENDEVFGDGYQWSRLVFIENPPVDEVVPDESALDVREDQSERDRYFGTVHMYMDNYEVIRKTADVVTLDGWSHRLVGDDDDVNEEFEPARFTITWQRAGSDGVAFGSCTTDMATTVLLADRQSCSEKLASAQAKKWAKVSPSLKFATTRAVVAHLPSTATVKAAPARNIARLSSGPATTYTARQGGKAVQKPYRAYWKKDSKRRVAPTRITVIQYGNSLNSSVAFASLRRAAAKSARVSGSGSTSFSYVQRSGSVYTGVAMMRMGAGVYQAKCDGRGTGASSRAAQCARGLLSSLVKAQTPIVVR